MEHLHDDTQHNDTYTGAPLGLAPTLLTSIRLGREGLPRTNGLAYSATKKKKVLQLCQLASEASSSTALFAPETSTKESTKSTKKSTKKPKSARYKITLNL